MADDFSLRGATGQEDAIFLERTTVSQLKKLVQVAVLEEMFQGGGISLIGKDSMHRFIREDGPLILQ